MNDGDNPQKECNVWTSLTEWIGGNRGRIKGSQLCNKTGNKEG